LHVATPEDKQLPGTGLCAVATITRKTGDLERLAIAGLRPVTPADTPASSAPTDLTTGRAADEL
jgi:hypothetical protein